MHFYYPLKRKCSYIISVWILHRLRRNLTLQWRSCFSSKYCPVPAGFKFTVITNAFTIVQSTEARIEGLIASRLTAGLGIDSTVPISRADERMARGPKKARGKISLAHGIHCSPSSFFISLARPLSLYCEERARVCVCVCTYLTAWRLCMNYRCYQTILRMNHFYTNRELWEVLRGYLALDAGLAVTGRARDIGQSVLQSSF